MRRAERMPLVGDYIKSHSSLSGNLRKKKNVLFAWKTSQRPMENRWLSSLASISSMKTVFKNGS